MILKLINYTKNNDFGLVKTEKCRKATQTGIILCPKTIRLLKGKCRLNYIERVSIKGRTNRTFPLYELWGMRNTDLN